MSRYAEELLLRFSERQGVSADHFGNATGRKPNMVTQVAESFGHWIDHEL